MKKPVYLKIKEQIMSEIEEKSSNQAIESERKLSERLKASRMTVRRALNELVEEGYLYREQNVGTFVADKSHWKKNTLLAKPEADNIEYRLINFDVKYAIRDEILEKLNLSDQDYFSMIRAIRLVLVNGKPQKVEEFHIIRDFIDEKNINKFDVLLDVNRYLETSTLSQRLVPTLVPPKYAAALKLRINEPIIKIEGTIISNKGEPYIYFESYNHPREKIIEITE